MGETPSVDALDGLTGLVELLCSVGGMAVTSEQGAQAIFDSGFDRVDVSVKRRPLFQVYSVVNDAGILARNLQRSPDLVAKDIPLSLLWDKSSAAAAYAEACQGAEADFLIFAHQDVYLPDGWFRAFEDAVENLSRLHPEWAVAGLYGVTDDGKAVGHVWDSGQGGVWGQPFGAPVAVASIDELLLIIRRGAGVTFDPALPGFHLYGTDIVLTARNRRRTAYVLDVPAIHNSKRVRHLGQDYLAAYRYMVCKWRQQLPWPTVIVPLARRPWRLAIHRLRLRLKSALCTRRLGDRLKDPASKARELGFEPL